VLASAAAMDKEFGKKLLAAEGLPIGPYACCGAGSTRWTRKPGNGWGCPFS